MRVLFLDFDGVLNHREHFARLSPNRIATEVEYDDNSFDRACVARLNTIVERTGCDVVISSSWRCMYPFAKLLRILRHHGFAHEQRVIGTTPGMPNKDRGDEIQAWLDMRRPAGATFVILDDNSDMGHLLPRLVKTSFELGLQDEHVDRVVAMLEAP